MFLFCTFFFLLPLLISAAPAAYREITVPAKAAGLSANVRTFIPLQFKGIRLADQQGKEIPIRITDRHGSELSFFFNPGNKTKFRLEFYNQDRKTKPAQQKSGVLHYYREYNGHEIKTEKDFRAAWARTNTPIRMEWIPGIYTGINRLGRTYKSLNVYSGFFRIDKDQAMVFYTASTDASFLLVDGKLTAAYPGYHSVYPALYGKYQGTVHLKKGIHKIEYLHANAQWTYFAVAARSKPKAKRMLPLKRDFFLPVTDAQAGPLLSANGQKLPDHQWGPTVIVDIDGMQFVQFTADKKTPYYFFTPDERTVLDGFELRNRYFFSAPYPSNKAASEAINSFLRQYPDGKPYTPQAARFLAAAIPLFASKEAALKFYDKIIKTGDKMPVEHIFKFYQASILTPRLEKEEYERAVQELQPMLAKNKSGASFELARLYLYGIGDPKKAQQYIKETLPAALAPNGQKQYPIVQADLALFLDSFEAAAELYGKMDSMTKSMSARRLVESEGAVISLRNALITKRYKDALSYLEQIEKARPEIRINPEIMWLKARFFAELGYPRRAAVLCRAILRTHPIDSVASGALFYLAKHEKQRGNEKEAAVLFNQLKREFPNSKEAAEADSFTRSK